MAWPIHFRKGEVLAIQIKPLQYLAPSEVSFIFRANFQLYLKICITIEEIISKRVGNWSAIKIIYHYIPHWLKIIANVTKGRCSANNWASIRI